jgi:hypothetical protein
MQERGYDFRKDAIGIPLTGSSACGLPPAPRPRSLIQRSLRLPPREGAGARPTTPTMKYAGSAPTLRHSRLPRLRRNRAASCGGPNRPHTREIAGQQPVTAGPAMLPQDQPTRNHPQRAVRVPRP